MGERFVLFTPAANFNGQATFLYQITDLRTPIASRLTDTALVTVTVTPEQDAPIANDDTYTHAEDSTVRNHNVVANDIDNDNSPPSNVGLCISAVTTAPNKGGTATITGACPTTVQYTPAPNFNGEEIYYYTVEDPQGNVSNAGKVTVTITPSNDHPVAVNGITFTIDPNFPDPSAGGAVTDLKPDNGMGTARTVPSRPFSTSRTPASSASTPLPTPSSIPAVPRPPLWFASPCLRTRLARPRSMIPLRRSATLSSSTSTSWPTTSTRRPTSLPWSRLVRPSRPAPCPRLLPRTTRSTTCRRTTLSAPTTLTTPSPTLVTTRRPPP